MSFSSTSYIYDNSIKLLLYYIVTCYTAGLSFDDVELEPYTEYTYHLTAENDYGTALSPSVTYRTLASLPSNDSTLTTVDIWSRSAALAWTAPSQPWGSIQVYHVYATNNYDSAAVELYQGLSTSVTVEDLEPYTNYTAWVEACTVAGCSPGPTTQFTTDFAAPEQQMPPVVQAISVTQLLVSWQPPLKPNGAWSQWNSINIKHITKSIFK